MKIEVSQVRVIDGVDGVGDRLHQVSEFDDAKRSCRRRLAGHNERRRKSSHDSVPSYSSQGIYSSIRILTFLQSLSFFHYVSRPDANAKCPWGMSRSMLL